jgi:hypothetical protein
MKYLFNLYAVLFLIGAYQWGTGYALAVEVGEKIWEFETGGSFSKDSGVFKCRLFIEASPFVCLDFAKVEMTLVDTWVPCWHSEMYCFR